MRILLFAGKGGVGKTSVAAATGARAADMGHRTVVISLDVAHSLSDIFDIKTDLHDKNKGQPVNVSKNLWIQEIDIQEEIENNWNEIYKYISLVLNSAGLDEILAEELAILPGMEEITLLLYINQYVTNKEFDVIILDCAPTGESLRFISIPTALEWYMKKIFKIQRVAARYIRVIAKRITNIPLPDDDYFQAIEDIFNRLRGVNDILIDPKITTVRLVANPEKIVLKETQRALMYYCLYNMNIDGIILNRMLPQSINDSYFDEWRKRQHEYIEMAQDIFKPIPIFYVDLFKEEVLGLENIKQMSDVVYANKDPLELFYDEKPYDLIKENEEYKMTMKLPFIMKKDVHLSKISDELIIRVGSYKRNILLPYQVAAKKSISAKMEGLYLNIFFKGDNDDKE